MDVYKYKKILLVNDSPSISFIENLEDKTHTERKEFFDRTLFAFDIYSASEYLESKNIDLIICEGNLPISLEKNMRSALTKTLNNRKSTLLAEHRKQILTPDEKVAYNEYIEDAYDYSEGAFLILLDLLADTKTGVKFIVTSPDPINFYRAGDFCTPFYFQGGDVNTMREAIDSIEDALGEATQILGDKKKNPDYFKKMLDEVKQGERTIGLFPDISDKYIFKKITEDK